MTISLFELLPAIYRDRDAEAGGALAALMATFQIEYDAVHANIGALYDGWFVETCPDWAVPYIAQLLGIRGLGTRAANLPRQRARVGNSQLYRGRKGSMAVLAAAAGDATGWTAVARDGPAQLVCSQRLAHADPARGGSARLSGADTAAWGGTPFWPAARAPAFRDGCLPRLVPQTATLSLWRVQAMPITGVTPGRADGIADGFTFSPFGIDTPLHTLPATPDGLFADRTPQEVPLALTRRRLALLIARARAGDAPPAPFAIRVRRAGRWHAVPLAAVVIGRVEGTAAMPARQRWGRGRDQVADIEAMVDPERGRFRLATPAEAIVVDYVYGLGLEIGGGPYERGDRLPAAIPGAWHATVAARRDGEAPAVAGCYADLESALAAWPAGRAGVVTILDNASYTWPARGVELTGRALVVQAANGCRPAVAGALASRVAPDVITILIYRDSILDIASCTNSFSPKVFG